MALGFVVGGLLVSFALARLITKPLDSLAAGIQVVARGDLRRLVPVSSSDEIGKLTNVFNQMILSLREKLLMEKYLSQPTVQSIKEHRDMTQLKLGGERKYVTALFSDARGFTSLSEKMSPEDVVRLMNVYLNLQAKVIHQFGGTIDKFVGDEVMAIFEGRGNEINAVRAAVEIQSYCKALNAARSAAGGKDDQHRDRPEQRRGRHGQYGFGRPHGLYGDRRQHQYRGDGCAGSRSREWCWSARRLPRRSATRRR